MLVRASGIVDSYTVATPTIVRPETVFRGCSSIRTWGEDQAQELGSPESLASFPGDYRPGVM